MARTVDIAAHLIRREAFVSTATRLFQTKGHDETSIRDILDTVGTSRGAFYHYFGSKGALLDAVVEQMVEEALRTGSPQLDAPGLTFEDVQRTFDACLDAFDRVLGARPGSFPRVAPEALRPWLGPGGKKGPA